MEILFTILTIVVALLLILVVLVQRSKGGGLASNIGITTQFLGAKKETDTVEKATWVLIAALVVLSLGSGFAFKKGARLGSPDDIQIEAPTIDNTIQSSPTAPQIPMGGGEGG